MERGGPGVMMTGSMRLFCPSGRGGNRGLAATCWREGLIGCGVWCEAVVGESRVLGCRGEAVLVRST